MASNNSNNKLVPFNHLSYIEPYSVGYYTAAEPVMPVKKKHKTRRGKPVKADPPTSATPPIPATLSYRQARRALRARQRAEASASIMIGEDKSPVQQNNGFADKGEQQTGGVDAKASAVNSNEDKTK